MSDDPAGPLDDEYVARLTSHDDALADCRPTNLAEEMASLPPAVRERLEEYGGWCEFVRAALSVMGDGSSQDEAPSLVQVDTPRRLGRVEAGGDSRWLLGGRSLQNRALPYHPSIRSGRVRAGLSCSRR